jgi:hypothetical protein
MKREFGKKLIEVVFRERVELSHVIDTSGAFIPGHGTPTVILVGRNRIPNPERTVRAVLGVRGEPTQPDVPAEAAVWLAIVDQVDQPRSGSEEWVSVEDAPAERFAAHPWSVSGGGAGEVFASIEGAAVRRLAASSYRIGVFGVLGADDAMIAPQRVFGTRRMDPTFTSRLVVGDEVRDWVVGAGENVIFPYSSDHSLWALDESPVLEAWLWPLRTELGNRATFSKRTYFAEGRPWYEWHQLPRDQGAAALTITLAFVATHNHFVLDRGGKAFNRSAPVIKLPEGAGEDAHLELLGLLNSSTACFWLKEVSHDKGSQSGTGGFMHDEWERFYEFTGTKIQEFPIPVQLPLIVGRLLDCRAQGLAQVEPLAACETGKPTRDVLDGARAEYVTLRQRMIALQEELDWQVYGLYGLLSDADVARATVASLDQGLPEVQLGERAFEIVLARQVTRGDAETVWFDRHGSTLVTEIPERWPQWYRDIVQTRIDIIERRKDIGLIERPEYKRRWSVEPWEKKEKAALRAWLLDRCEDPELWFRLRDGAKQPRTLTVNQMADALSSDADFNSVAALYASDHLNKPDLPLGQVLADVVAEEHVPYLAAMRYKDSGLRKREQWEDVWEQQREEDRTGQRLDIPVPPKYSSVDFLKTSYWSNRGKLDVPKERFISYLDAGPDADPTVLLGWAGWDHKDQAQALINLIEDRTEQSGWDTERLTPLLAGLHEVMPWVRQWHGEYDAEWESVPAEECDAFLDEQMGKHRLSAADLKAWRPVKRARGRKAAASKKASAPEQSALDVE